MDYADKAARAALKPYRRGSQINAGCVEIYDVVAAAIRDAYEQGAMGATTRKKVTAPTKHQTADH